VKRDNMTRSVDLNPDKHSSNEPHLKDYLRILYVRKWILVSVFFVVVMSVTAYVFIQTPTYRAGSTLLIEPSNPNVTEFNDVYDPAMSDGDFNRQTFLETQYKLLLSRPLIEKSFRHFGFGEMKEFRELRDPIVKFMSCFLVSPIKRTRLVGVSFEWKDPELAARVIEYHVDEFLSNCRKRRLGVSEEGLIALRAKADDLKPQVEEKAKAMQHFMAHNEMVSFEKAQDIVVERLKAINQNLTDAENKRILAQARYNDIANALKENLPLERMPEIISSEAIRDLKLEFTHAEQEVSDLENHFGPNHPEALSAEAKLASVAEKMKSEISQILASAEAEYTRAAKQESELKKVLDEQQKKVMALNEKSVDYTLISQSYEDLNRAYRVVTQRIQEIETAMAAGDKEDNIFIIAKPRIPIRPAKPRKLLSIALSLMVGLLLGIGLCFFVEYLDTTIKTKSDVEQFLGVPVMGFVPPVGGDGRRNGGNGKKQVEFEAVENPHSALAEAFRSIRTALSFSNGGKGLKTFLVTSAVPSEGKTIVSLNTAIALAKAGKKVLLVDADMRRPRLSRVFESSSMQGLSSLLVNKEGVTLETAAVSSGGENLHILPSGPIPPNPAELLGNENVPGLLAEMSSRYDHVVFDTPPVVTTTDAAVLCGYMEGSLLVVRAHSTQKDTVRRAGEVLSSARCRLVGAVLNSVDMPKGGQYGYGGYYYYGKNYHEESGAGGKKNKIRHGRSKSRSVSKETGREMEKVS